MYSSDLPGLHTQGDSLEDAAANAREALALTWKDFVEQRQPIGSGIIRRKLRVPAA